MSNVFPSRSINTREPYRMNRPYEADAVEIMRHFEIAKDEVNSITGCLKSSGKSSSEKEAANYYLWRSQMIMAYSAFDLFMHEMLYYSLQKMRRTTSYLAKSDEFKNYWEGLSPEDDESFKESFTDKYGYITLTKAETWGKAIKWMGISKWKVAESYLNKYEIFDTRYDAPDKALDKILIEKTARRNKLVHSYDYNVPGGIQERIDEKTSKEFIRFVSNLVGVVYAFVDEKWNGDRSCRSR